MKNQIITLSGFGDFSENMQEGLSIQDAAKKHGVEFYPTYYDHELKGAREAVEAITMELWSMPSDQWKENALYETVLHTHVLCRHCKQCVECDEDIDEQTV